MKLQNNIILNVDSYKASQWVQYPPNTEYVYSYIESRGHDTVGFDYHLDETVFFGLQAFIKEYLLTPITQEDIDVAEEIITTHGEPFNRSGWEYILKKHGGKLPVRIKAVPEGTVMPLGHILVSVENTDPMCFWLTSYLETALLRAVWYPTTVASKSRLSKKIIFDGLQQTGGDLNSIGFKLHDFGARGVSSLESAAIGGAAHLINFSGTDTISALLFAKQYYHADMAGFSIPAMEHSTVTSWSKDKEVESYRNMLKQYGKPGAILACVSDSYDIYEACKLWGTELKDEVIASGATVVIRPDSGYPPTVVLQCVKILDKYFGHTINSAGYKVLNNVRVIQGDGITHESIAEILEYLFDEKYSADNVAFGQGGALLQQVNRDTLKFAMKASAAKVDGEWIDVFKDPKTDSGKRSKKGKLKLIETFDKIKTVREDEAAIAEFPDILRTVYENGELTVDDTFDMIRDRAKIISVKEHTYL